MMSKAVKNFVTLATSVLYNVFLYIIILLIQ